MLVLEVAVGEGNDVFRLLSEDLAEEVVQNLRELLRNWKLLEICAGHADCFIINSIQALVSRPAKA